MSPAGNQPHPGCRDAACGTYGVMLLQWPDANVSPIRARMIPAPIVEAERLQIWSAPEYNHGMSPDEAEQF